MDSVEVNEVVQIHGGDIHRASRTLKCRPEEILDFSASINPLGPSPLAMKAVQESGFSCLAHYPDPDCRDLREALGKYHRIDPGKILVGNGSSELIHLLVHALKITRALVPLPAFSEYVRAIRRSGGEAALLPARKERAYRWTFEEVVGGFPGMEALFLCNPDNPTGQLHERKEMSSIIEAAASRGLWVIVDEAFIDFQEEESLIGSMRRGGPAPENLILLRSLTKFFGLAGLRIGYLAAHPAVAERVRRHQPPWSVNQPAQWAALESLRDRGHREKSLALIEEERAFLFSGLGEIPGLHPLPSSANYLLVEIEREGLTSTDLTRRLLEDRILIRDCRSFPGLDGEYFRIAVRRREENERLLGSLRKHLEREA